MEARESGPALAAEWDRLAERIAASLEQSSWDGEWYLRGLFDNGVALGSHASEELKVDSLPQSWAVISQAGDAGRARRAMESAEKYLVDKNDRLVLLFTPPFDHSLPHPGYIMGYPPGLRENGGQYTHGSLWLAMGWARLGDGGRAVHLLKMMNPVELSRNPEDVARYRGEPYALAADVSSAPGLIGRCGWTWYTGSAGWMYRIWIEEVLGFQVRGDTLTLHPVLPAEWPGFEMTYRYRSARYEIAVHAGNTTGTELDGAKLDDGRIHLADDGAVHHVVVRIARQPVASPAEYSNSASSEPVVA
jgi:cyclic beta-1,2-glucan synthetase